MTYDHFKVFSNREKLDKLFSHTQLGKKRFIFIFDEGMFCEAAMALGYSAIYIGTDEELAKVIDAAAAHSFTGRENIIFPLCKKHVTEALWAAMNDTSRLISGAWRYFYAQERTRELYRCRRDLLDAAITKLAADYTVKSIGTVSAKRFSDVEEKPVDWLWEPYIARGCLTILFAEPGAGKTFFTCWLASRLSNGDALPGAPPEKWVEPQKCVSVFFNSEDSEEYTLKPRLRGCGAALENVLCVPCDDCAGLTFSSPDIENGY